MGLPVKTQLRYWGIAAAVFAIVLWYLGNVLMPFILGGAIAYCLDPVADKLERWGLSRVLATVTITVIAIFAFVIAFLLVIPVLSQQALALFEAAPDLFRDLRAFLNERFPSQMSEDSPVQQTLASIGETIRSKGGELLNSVLVSAQSLLNIVVLVVIVPVVAFYLLLDWDRMVAQVDSLLPRDHVQTVRELAREVDSTLAAFIRGQGTVMSILGLYYALALFMVGLNFGLIVGVVAGLISFIPYVGAVVGGGLALGLAIFQFWGEWWLIGIVAGIFAAGKVIEGNFLTPKLVGGSVGLHPVWLLFALSVFGSLFGFVGMLVAVPLAASLGVITRFFMGTYQSSRLYRGLDQMSDD